MKAGQSLMELRENSGCADCSVGGGVESPTRTHTHTCTHTFLNLQYHGWSQLEEPTFATPTIVIGVNPLIICCMYRERLSSNNTQYITSDYPTAVLMHTPSPWSGTLITKGAPIRSLSEGVRRGLSGLYTNEPIRDSSPPPSQASLLSDPRDCLCLACLSL